MKLILAVTTVPELQLLMGEAGLVPVLREFPESLLKERHPAWKENLDTIRDALASGKPRPRSMQWRDIEKELARQIRNGEFASREGLSLWTIQRHTSPSPSASSLESALYESRRGISVRFSEGLQTIGPDNAALFLPTVVTENRILLTIVELIGLGLVASFDRVPPYIRDARSFRLRRKRLQNVFFWRFSDATS